MDSSHPPRRRAVSDVIHTTQAVDDFVASLKDDELVAIQTEDSTECSIRVSKALLCRSSKYFASALNGNWKESEERRLTLPGSSNETVKQLVYWLHQGSLSDYAAMIDDIREHHPTIRPPGQLRLTHMLLARLWMLAGQLLMPKLQNEAMRRILGIMEESVAQIETMMDVYRITESPNKLREVFLVDTKLWYDRGELARNDLEEIDEVPGLLVEMLEAEIDARGSDLDKAFRSVKELGDSHFMVSEEDCG